MIGAQLNCNNVFSSHVFRRENFLKVSPLRNNSNTVSKIWSQLGSSTTTKTRTKSECFAQCQIARVETFPSFVTAKYALWTVNIGLGKPEQTHLCPLYEWFTCDSRMLLLQGGWYETLLIWNTHISDVLNLWKVYVSFKGYKLWKPLFLTEMLTL